MNLPTKPTLTELRDMARQIEADLLEHGDPFSGDDWAMMQVVRAYLEVTNPIGKKPEPPTGEKAP